jgi:hypothetical protein
MKATSLLGSDFEDRCKVNLTPCEKCGTERVFAEQRFCMKCGNELKDGSVYSEMLGASIDALPLPFRKIDDIREHTSLRTVGDVLADDQQQLLGVPYIGPFWAQRIYSAAQEFVSV